MKKNKKHSCRAILFVCDEERPESAVCSSRAQKAIWGPPMLYLVFGTLYTSLARRFSVCVGLGLRLGLGLVIVVTCVSREKNVALLRLAHLHMGDIVENDPKLLDVLGYCPPEPATFMDVTVFGGKGATSEKNASVGKEDTAATRQTRECIATVSTSTPRHSKSSKSA